MSTSDCESVDTYVLVVWRGRMELSCSVGLVFLLVRGARGKFPMLFYDAIFGEKSARDALLTGSCNVDKQRVKTWDGASTDLPHCFHASGVHEVFCQDLTLSKVLGR